MARMKALYEMLQETEQYLAENEPLSIDCARKIVAAAQDIALRSIQTRLQNVRPREDQTQMPM